MLHIRPPTEIEIRRFLYQEIGKNSAFIRNVQRRRTAHGSTGQSGSHLTWPEDKYVQRLNSSLQSRGITLKALQECKEPLEVAKVVLPIFLTSKNRITDEGAIRARQLLTNVVLKPEWFIDETLLQLPEDGLVGHTKSRIPHMSEQGRDGGVSNPDSHVSRSYDIIPEYQPSLVPGALEIPQEGPGVIFQGGLTNPHYHSGRGWHLGSDGTSLVQGVSPFTHNDHPDLVPAALRIPDHSYAAAPQTSYTYPEHLLGRSWLPSSEEIPLFQGMSAQTHNEQLPQAHGVYNDANVRARQGTTLPLPHPHSLSLQNSSALSGPESVSQWNHYTDLSHGATERQQHEQYGPYGLYQQAFPPRPAPLRGQHGGSSSSSHPGGRQREGSLDREQQENLRNMPGGSIYPFY